MIIFFDIGLAVIFLILFFLMGANAVAALLLKALLVICIIFCIKILVQDIYCVMYQRHHIVAGIISIAINLFRMHVFYHFMRIYAIKATSGSGGQRIANMVEFVIALVFGFGFILFVGETIEFLYAGDTGEEHPVALLIGNFLFTLVCTLLYLADAS